MSKLRYGPRFKTTIVDTRYQYNELNDLQERRFRQMGAAMLKNMPLHKKELARHRASATAKAKAAGHEREEAEQRMAEAIRKVVAMLEFNMTEMMQHHKINQRPSYCNQQAIHNIIFELRHKCGVQFASEAEFDHRVSLTPHINTDKRDLENKMYEQRAARERRFREIADRLIARKHE